MKTLIYLILLLLIMSCSLDPKIEITKDYISNKDWDEYNNSIHVEKMKVNKDSILNIFDANFKEDIPNHWNITNKLEVDSTFYFGYSGLNIKEDKVKLQDKVFFNKDNGFTWYSADGNTNIVGSLENNTWYKFSDLKTIPYYIYIFVDNTGKVHRFNVDMSNY